MKSKIIGIIPARYNSKRFFGKMLYKIGSKTLLQHTFENAKRCNIFDSLYIVTEDEIIKNEAKNIKAPYLMTKVCASGTHRIIEALKENQDLKTSDIIVNIQGDHPKIKNSTIKETINILKNDKTAHASTAVCKIDYELAKSENIVKCVMNNKQNALYFSRSLIPHSKTPKDISYFYHIGLYAYRTEFLYELSKLEDSYLQQSEDLEQLKILENGYKIKVAIVDDMPLGIDVKDDLKKVEKILCQ
ncbi:MAG: 3-deoxy-manno-octulosonate cytidylyltransferase [Candidatus Anoxychlamydiales bacterium]|nr:3-deoxy-manno-octulosonate cytidylyltransferase [Candidatus Anoxychlamydiales bacterium]